MCKSPNVPVPYPIVDFCGHDENYTPSVRFTGQKAMVLRSNTRHVHGDEPGVGKGVKSGTVGDISEPIGHARNVRAEGSNVIRHLDKFWMNNKNTVGEAVFVRDTKTYEAPPDDDPVPGSLVMSDLAAQKIAQPVQQQQANAGTFDGSMTDGSQSGTIKAPSIKIPGLRRAGLFGILVEQLARDLQSSPAERAAEARALQTILSAYGQQVIKDQKLLGGRDTIGSLSELPKLLSPSTWRGKYGVIVDPEERIPLANDILSQAAGRPMDVRTMTDEEVRTVLSQARSEEGEDDNVRVDQPKTHEVECFEVSSKYDREEYREQLKKQEEELNELSPEEYIRRRENYANGTTSRSGKPQREARDRYRSDRTIELITKRGMDYDDAIAKADEELEGLAALHALDLVAGGIDKIWRMGHRGINSSIGSKWIKKGRLDKMDEYAKNIKGKQKKMKVEIDDC